MSLYDKLVAYYGSSVLDGSTDISAASVRDITLYFNRSTRKLPKTDAERLGIATPTLTVTATPKGGDTQTLVEGIDYFQSSRNEVILCTSSSLTNPTSDQFVDKFDFDGLTKDNVFDYFNRGTFYANVPMPDTTYTITYSPNYFWNPFAEKFYDKEISITFATRPVQATLTLTFKRDMVQKLANTRVDGIASLVEDNTGCEIRHLRGRSVLTQGMSDATSKLYDYAVSRFSRYRIVDLSKWDSLGYANWYTGMTDEMKSNTAVISGTTYATSAVGANNWTYHYYDVHLEVW